MFLLTIWIQMCYRTLPLSVVRQAEEAWTTPDTLNQNLHSNKVSRYVQVSVHDIEEEPL